MARISASRSLNIKTGRAQKSEDFFPRHRLAEYTRGSPPPLNCGNQAIASRRVRSPDLAGGEIAEVIFCGRARGGGDVACDVLESPGTGGTHDSEALNAHNAEL
jgi:hypothetical protein